MEVHVLGPLRALDDESAPIELGPKERVVLARLAAARRRPVSEDVLMMALWSTPPASARKTLQGYIHRLRRGLGASAVSRDPAGYRLEAVDLDLDRVEGLIELGRAGVAAGERDRAASSFREARSLFRGPPFPELVDDPSSAGLHRQLAELELRLTEELFDIEVFNGHANASIGELESVVAADGSREHMWWLLANAYAVEGRQADALGAISRARRALAVELGIEPGIQLRELEQGVLDQTVPAVSTRHRSTSRQPISPNTLPAALAAVSDEIPLVGRGPALDRLAAAHRAAVAEGRPRFEIIVGEAGIGKTRLSAEFARAVHSNGTTVLFGRCSEELRTAFEPLQQAIQHLARLERGVAAEARTLSERLAIDAPVVDGGTTPAAARHELFEQIADVLEGAAREAPLLIVLDDLHWAASPTMQALEHVARRSMHAPLLVIATVRSPEFGATDVIGPLGVLPGVHLLRLDGLDLAGVRDFLSASGRRPDASADSAIRLHDWTGGNAFMIGEIVRSDGAGDLRSDVVPDLVRDVIVARARRLPERAFDLLQLASIVGLDFDLDIVIQASGADATVVVEALDAAITAQLIVEQPTIELTYRFRHAMVRDALVATMTKAKQALLHRQVGDALAATTDRSLTALTRLAHHYLLSPGPLPQELGRQFAQHAGDASIAAYAYDEAYDWYERARSSDPIRDCEALLSMATAATLAGHEQRAREAAERAWRIARQINDGPSEVTAALLYAGEPELNVVGDEPGTMILSATMDLGSGSDGERSRVMARLGSALSFTQHQRATDLGVAALELARNGRSPTDVAYAIRCRLRGWFDPDCIEQRLALADELLSIGRAAPDAVTESWGWRWRTAALFEVGDIAGIEVACTELAQLGAQLRLPNQQWSAANRRATTCVLQGRFAQADELFSIARSHAEGLDNELHLSATRSATTVSAWLRGTEHDPSALVDRPAEDVSMLWLRDDPTPSLDLLAAEPQRFFTNVIARLGDLCSLALTLRNHQRQDVATILYPIAAHDAHLVGTIAPAAAMFGSMHLYAGIIARTAGLHDAALQHMQRAIAVNTSMGASPFVALAKHELAKSMGQTEKSRKLAAEAHQLAIDLGIPWL